MCVYFLAGFLRIGEEERSLEKERLIPLYLKRAFSCTDYLIKDDAVC